MPIDSVNPEKVLVLMAAYNGSKWIIDQVDSILNQANVVVKIVISVDLSDDNTYDIVNDYALEKNNVEILSYGERYGGAAKNFFRLIMDVDFNGFDYIAFSDQDDLWLKEKCCRAISELKKNNADGYSSDATAFWQDGRETKILKSQNQKEYDYFFESAGPGCTFLLSSNLAKNIQHFSQKNKYNIDKVWMHDWFIYAFSRFNKYRWTIDKKSFIMYRQHDSNAVGANIGFGSFLNRLKKILNGDYFYQVSLISSVLGLDNTHFIRNIDIPFGLCRLSIHSRQCRRKSFDQLLLFFASLILCVTNKAKFIIKRIFDIVLSMLLIIVFIIPMFVIYLLIITSSEGRAIYWSDRIGVYNKTFKMPKFRTMKVDAPEIATHLLSEPEKYITSIGSMLRSTSLDELPQLFSVLKGDMSFVGPRPALHNQHDLIRLRRNAGVDKLLPGITGWAQINGRDSISIDQKVDLDVYYMNKMTLFLDIKIIFLTFFSVFVRKDVSH